jgi:hypothetical protein
MNRRSNILLVACMILGVYVLTYFMSVKPAPLVAISGGPGPWSRAPEYRFGDWSEVGYAPILWLDRKFFPSRWQVTRAQVQKNTSPGAAP